MAINYLFYSLLRSDRLSGPFDALYRAFWVSYLELSCDRAIGFVIQPYFAWRALVLASPQWYPTLSDNVRQHAARLCARRAPPASLRFAADRSIRSRSIWRRDVERSTAGLCTLVYRATGIRQDVAGAGNRDLLAEQGVGTQSCSTRMSSAQS